MNDNLLKTAVAAANAEWARAERYRLAWLSARHRAAYGHTHNHATCTHFDRWRRPDA